MWLTSLSLYDRKRAIIRLFGNRKEFTDIAGHQKTMNQFCVSHVELSITQSRTNLRFLHPPQAVRNKLYFKPYKNLEQMTCLLQRWFVINSPSNFPRHNVTASQLQVLSRNKSQHWYRLCARTEPNGYRIDLHNRNDYHSQLKPVLVKYLIADIVLNTSCVLLSVGMM